MYTTSSQYKLKTITKLHIAGQKGQLKNLMIITISEIT